MHNPIKEIFIKHLAEKLASKIQDYHEMEAEMNQNDSDTALPLGKKEKQLIVKKTRCAFIPNLEAELKANAQVIPLELGFKAKADVGTAYTESFKTRIDHYENHRKTKIKHAVKYLSLGKDFDIKQIRDEVLYPLAIEIYYALEHDLLRLRSKHQVENLADAITNKILRSLAGYGALLKGNSLADILRSALVYPLDNKKTDMFSQKEALHHHIFFKSGAIKTVHHILKQLEVASSVNESLVIFKTSKK